MDRLKALIATRLEERRTAVGILTKKEAADELGILASTYKNWELAIRTPSYEDIERIGELYRTNPAYFIGWTDDPRRIKPPKPRAKSQEPRAKSH